VQLFKGNNLTHHSSENKNVTSHLTITEYIILTNYVAWMHLPFVSPNVQKADVATSEKCENSLLQTITAMNL